MQDFVGTRLSYHYTQTNPALPAQVFPLLCPVREADWLPGWKYRLIYSQSGIAELGCVFTTPHEDGTETTWIATEYDPHGFRVAYAWVKPGLVAAQIRIELAERHPGATRADISYAYTGLSAEGNKTIAGYTEAWFQQKMQGWERAINHYLQTGKLISAAG